MSKIILAPTDMLVERLEDYYKKDDQFVIDKDDKYIVGIITYAGVLMSKERIGKIVYYHKNIAMEINLKGIGRFDLVTESVRLLIREDQDKDNY